MERSEDASGIVEAAEWQISRLFRQFWLSACWQVLDEADLQSRDARMGLHRKRGTNSESFFQRGAGCLLSDAKGAGQLFPEGNWKLSTLPHVRCPVFIEPELKARRSCEPVILRPGSGARNWRRRNCWKRC